MESKVVGAVYSWDVQVYWNVVCNMMRNKYRKEELELTHKMQPPLKIVMEEGSKGAKGALEDPSLVKLICDGMECTLADVWGELAAHYEWGDSPSVFMASGVHSCPAGACFRVVYETRA